MDYGTPTKLLTAKRIAAALGYIGLVRGDRVSVQGFHQTLPTVVRGRSSTHRFLGSVSDILADPTPLSLEAAVKKFCLRTTSKGIVVVISDLMDKQGYESALKMLAARNFDVFVIHMLSPEELNPSLAGDLKLVDCEDQDVREISVSAGLLMRYQATLNAFIEGAKLFCGKRSITYVPAKSDASVELLVDQYLRVRGLVR